MSDLSIGDIVKRKSYGGDVFFKISDIINSSGRKPVFILKGLLFRLQADSTEDDLIKVELKETKENIRKELTRAKRQAHPSNSGPTANFLFRLISKPGRIVHIDSSDEFLDKCLDFYTRAGIKSVGKLSPEANQPEYVRYLLSKYNPDILVITGHDALKKGNTGLYSLDSYRTSRYFIESVREARKFEPNYDRLCIFAGACQSYYEAIMDAGANFASSPGRVFINALDPAIVAEKVTLTDSRKMVTPAEIAEITISGRKGIWGIDTRGHLK